MTASAFTFLERRAIIMAVREGFQKLNFRLSKVTIEVVEPTRFYRLRLHTRKLDQLSLEEQHRLVEGMVRRAIGDMFAMGLLSVRTS